MLKNPQIHHFSVAFICSLCPLLTEQKDEQFGVSGREWLNGEGHDHGSEATGDSSRRRMGLTAGVEHGSMSPTRRPEKACASQDAPAARRCVVASCLVALGSRPGRRRAHPAARRDVRRTLWSEVFWERRKREEEESKEQKCPRVVYIKANKI